MASKTKLKSPLFVTGTDTGVGKTVVTGSISNQLRKKNRPFRVIKPVASGVTQTISDDSAILAHASGVGRKEISFVEFLAPLSPPVAAASENSLIDYQEVVLALESYTTSDSLLLIEGAGGLMSPISDSKLNIDIASDLNCHVVLVARDTLGAVNHTLLCLSALKARKIPIVAVVLSQPDHTKSNNEWCNKQQIVSFCDTPVFHVPYLENKDDFPDWHRLSQYIPIEKLFSDAEILEQ